MKAPLIAVWMLLPCNSTVTQDHVTRTTTAIACPDTFREAAGPFLAEGWTPPAKASRQEVSPPKKKKKKRKKKRRR